MHNIKIELYFYNSILKVTKMYPGEPITKKLSKMYTGEPITIFLRVNQLGLKSTCEDWWASQLLYIQVYM